MIKFCILVYIKYNIMSKKLKITIKSQNVNDSNIDVLFNDMARIISNYSDSDFVENASKYFGGNIKYDISVVDENEKKAPKNMSFSKWKKWYTKTK